MGKIELFFNIIHYCIYKIDVKLRRLSNKINPILYFYKLPFAKRHFEKMGKNPEDILNEASQDPEKGLSIMLSEGCMIACTVFLCFAIQNICFTIVHRILWEINLCIVGIYFLLSLFLNYYFLFRKDKYLNYFREFEEKSKKWKKKWGWATLSLIIGVLFAFIASFFLMHHMGKHR